MMRNPNIPAGQYQISLSWEPVLISPQDNNEVPQFSLPLTHDMSGNDIENLDFFYLVVTKCLIPCSWDGARGDLAESHDFYHRLVVTR